MFHYSLAPLSSRSRMLIATLLALVLHLGFINFEFDLKPVLVPRVSFSRSVSIFLGQRSMVETPVVQKEQIETAAEILGKRPAAETEPGKPVLHKVPKPKEIADNPLEHPAVMEKTAKQPAAETTRPAAQSSEYRKKEFLPDPGQAADVQEPPATAAEPFAVQENDGATLPGTLQMAYPRYRLNVPPAYPGLARKRGQEGTVVLQVLVNTNGRVDDLEIEKSSGFTSLDRAAAASVRQWSFEPGRRGEEKIPMRVRVPVTFKLK
jgi:protein TonB